MTHSETQQAEWIISLLHFMFIYSTSFSGMKNIFTACCSASYENTVRMRLNHTYSHIINIYLLFQVWFSELRIACFLFALPIHTQFLDTQKSLPLPEYPSAFQSQPSSPLQCLPLPIPLLNYQNYMYPTGPTTAMKLSLILIGRNFSSLC